MTRWSPLTREQAETATPVVLPGERVLRGQVIVFDMAARNNHLAREAVASAPTDLSAWSEDGLRRLRNQACRVWDLECGDDGPWNDVSKRASAELKARGLS